MTVHQLTRTIQHANRQAWLTFTQSYCNNTKGNAILQKSVSYSVHSFQLISKLLETEFAFTYKMYSNKTTSKYEHKHIQHSMHHGKKSSRHRSSGAPISIYRIVSYCIVVELNIENRN